MKSMFSTVILLSIKPATVSQKLVNGLAVSDAPGLGEMSEAKSHKVQFFFFIFSAIFLFWAYDLIKLRTGSADNQY